MSLQSTFPETTASIQRLRASWRELRRIKAEARYSRAILRAMEAMPEHAPKERVAGAMNSLLLAGALVLPERKP